MVPPIAPSTNCCPVRRGHCGILRRVVRPTFGGHLKQCDHCGRQVYAYHSCRNRHCPKCHGDQTERWLAQQQTRLLPGPYFLVTFTLPAELRPLAFANQKKVYGLLMRCAGASLQKLALDARYVGGRLSALAVLHTWTRAMRAGSPRGQPAWGASITRTFICW